MPLPLAPQERVGQVVEMFPARSLRLIAPTGGQDMQVRMVLPITPMRVEYGDVTPLEALPLDGTVEVIQTLCPAPHESAQHDCSVVIKGHPEHRWHRQNDVPIDDPQVSQVLHEGVIYRHIILTVPAMFRMTFYHNAAVVLSAFMRCVAQCLDDFYSTVKGKRLQGGYITVLHTHGRNGQYHPHLHVLATSGGYEAERPSWEHLDYLPYALLRRKWQWHLLTMLRQTLKTEAIKQLVDTCFRKYPDGLVTNVQKGAVPAQAYSVARYVAKYVVSPPISVRRIDQYNGEQVTYHYRSHRTERMEQ